MLQLLCVAVFIFPDVPNFTFFCFCCSFTTCHIEQISRDADFDVCVAISYSLIDFVFFKTCQLSLFFFLVGSTTCDISRDAVFGVFVVISYCFIDSFCPDFFG